MNNSYVVSRRHGLTSLQWGFLVVAFMVGLGSAFVVREFLPLVHAASVVQTVPSSHVSAK